MKTRVVQKKRFFGIVTYPTLGRGATLVTPSIDNAKHLVPYYYVTS